MKHYQKTLVSELLLAKKYPRQITVLKIELTFEVFYQNFQCLKNLFHINVTVKTLSYFKVLLRQ